MALEATSRSYSELSKALLNSSYCLGNVLLNSVHAIPEGVHLANDSPCSSVLQTLVAGARLSNVLHQATLSCPLDFFVLTTISSTVVRDASGAVESFQQLLARHRR